MKKIRFFGWVGSVHAFAIICSLSAFAMDPVSVVDFEHSSESDVSPPKLSRQVDDDQWRVGANYLKARGEGDDSVLVESVYKHRRNVTKVFLDDAGNPVHKRVRKKSSCKKYVEYRVQGKYYAATYFGDELVELQNLDEEGHLVGPIPAEEWSVVPNSIKTRSFDFHGGMANL